MKRLAVLGIALGALAAPALAHAAAPPIARPNPVVYPVRLDYADPLPGPDGMPAALAPLGHGVTVAATRDQAYLAYRRRDDLGGFVPAPIGELALSSGGRDVLSSGVRRPQIPLFQRAAGGEISSFTFGASSPSNPTPAPDNGNGAGVQPPPPPTPGSTVPPANQGFGGRADSGSGSSTTTSRPGGTTTTTTTSAPATPAATSTTTTAATTTTTTSGEYGGGGRGGAGGGRGSGCSGGSCASGSCGTPGIQIDSAPPGCVLAISTAAPGDSVSEVVTITNTSDTTYTLELRALGADNNHLWQDLQMDVFDPGIGPVSPLPPLQSWLGSFHVLTTLAPGQTVQYGIELYLPTTAGNADQNKSAVIAFDWKAVG